ncbi:tubulin-like doman-containing protein [Brevibacterium litoralis]|uniref:tubulin-like doman-containing protein n=1 Tax=Brevibacterium litoralis TaxID=3138935 RepID=UPI0032EC7E2F
MQKFLVVGCGGSGGEVLARMMDQLRSELAAAGIDDLPQGWQFVHVDVPVAADTDIPGMGNVADQGGEYIGTAPPAGRYPVLDEAVSSTLQAKDALDEFVTWAPRNPGSVHTPIALGAGQMRSIGRVITLNQIGTVRSGLERAVRKLYTNEANEDMEALARQLPGAGSFDRALPPMVLVVSSMAGGAGASMALDVCRVLTRINGVSAEQTAVFLVTPDIFPETYPGVHPNALGMFGEILAAQTTAAHRHDTRLLESLGQASGADSGIPFRRIFPVGRYQGMVDGESLFGDGSKETVYRGLARGLAALMASGQAAGSFRAYDLTNRLEPPLREYLGWGSDPGEPLLWGAFGYGRLSMGRDRYRHYASQRLARTAVDRLRDGHLQAGNPAGAEQQLNALADSQWPSVLAGLGLPAGPAPSTQAVYDWFAGQALDHGRVMNEARTLLSNQFAPEIPQSAGQAGASWVAMAGQFLQYKKPLLDGKVEDTAYRWAFDWAQRTEQAVTDTVAGAVAQFGLPYAREVVDRVRSYLEDHVVARLQEIGSAQYPDLGRVPDEVSRAATGVKGTLVAGSTHEDALTDAVQTLMARHTETAAAEYAVRVLRSLVSDVLSPLDRALEEANATLKVEQDRSAVKVGQANVITDVYAAWPSDQDLAVPDRFATAENELLLTPADSFGTLYESHLSGSLPGAGSAVPPFAQATVQAARHVISGLWPVADGEDAPGGLVRRTSRWVPGVFTRDPGSGAPISPSIAQYSLGLRPVALRERALEYVSRRGEAFEGFCSLSLTDWVRGLDGAGAQEVAGRKQELLSKFRETLTYALPLASVDPQIVAKIHGGKAVQYRYKFSTVPFADDPALVGSLEEALQRNPSIDPMAVEVLDRALAGGQDAAGITRIDVFGSYDNFTPIAFGGVLRRVSKVWNARADEVQREDFWTFRRSRPLPASLPMADAERQALVAGWYVAQLTGGLRIPGARDLATPVQVWDRKHSTWVSFPHPLLTPPERFVGSTFDWLPAVLESVLLAVMEAHHEPVLSSMRPYQALRETFDETPQGPRQGLSVLSAEDLFVTWLRDGTTPSGEPSRAHGADLQERYDNALDFLTKVHDFAASRVSNTEPGGTAPRGGIVPNRREGTRTPFFNDLARDIVAVTAELRKVLETAKEEAERAPGTSTGDAPIADLGNF